MNQKETVLFFCLSHVFQSPHSHLHYSFVFISYTMSLSPSSDETLVRGRESIAVKDFPLLSLFFSTSVPLCLSVLPFCLPVSLFWPLSPPPPNHSFHNYLKYTSMRCWMGGGDDPTNDNGHNNTHHDHKQKHFIITVITKHIDSMSWCRKCKYLNWWISQSQKNKKTLFTDHKNTPHRTSSINPINSGFERTFSRKKKFPNMILIFM